MKKAKKKTIEQSSVRKGSPIKGVMVYGILHQHIHIFGLHSNPKSQKSFLTVLINNPTLPSSQLGFLKNVLHLFSFQHCQSATLVSFALFFSNQPLSTVNPFYSIFRNTLLLIILHIITCSFDCFLIFMYFPVISVF